MASEKNAIGNCKRCGFRFPLRKLLYEVQPNREELRVCKECFDPYNIRDDADAFNTDEDQSLDDPTFNADESSMFAWAPVGNVIAVSLQNKFQWLS